MGTQAQCQRHRGARGLSPHTRQQAGLSHVHSPRPEARAHPRAHTEFGTSPLALPPHTHTLMLQRPWDLWHRTCVHTHKVPSCMLVHTHTRRTCSPSHHRSWNQISYQVPEARNVPCSAAPPPGHLALVGGSRSPSQRWLRASDLGSDLGLLVFRLAATGEHGQWLQKQGSKQGNTLNQFSAAPVLWYLTPTSFSQQPLVVRPGVEVQRPLHSHRGSVATHSHASKVGILDVTLVTGTLSWPSSGL